MSEYHRINGRLGAAIRELREQLLIYPDDVDARAALDQLLRQAQGGGAAPER